MNCSCPLPECSNISVKIQGCSRQLTRSSSKRISGQHGTFGHNGVANSDIFIPDPPTFCRRITEGLDWRIKHLPTSKSLYFRAFVQWTTSESAWSALLRPLTVYIFKKAVVLDYDSTVSGDPRFMYLVWETGLQMTDISTNHCLIWDHHPLIYYTNHWSTRRAYSLSRCTRVMPRAEQPNCSLRISCITPK